MACQKPKVDIVFCVDLARSMQNRLEDIKAFIISFWPELEEHYSQWNKEVSEIRAKVILFNNSSVQSEIQESEFYNLKEADNKEGFVSYIESINPTNSLFKMNNAVKALLCAIQTKWKPDDVLERDFVRHIIVLFTGGNKNGEYEIDGFVANEDNEYSLDMLTDIWNDGNYKHILSPRGKRLVLFAPQEFPWKEIFLTWNYVIWCSSSYGCKECSDNVCVNELFEAIVSPI